MRKWVPYPFVRFTFYLILGILAGLYLEGWIQAVSILAALSLAFYISLQVLSSRGIHQYYAFPIGICAFFALILLGYINVYLSDEKNNPAHLFHKGSTVSQQAYYYQAKVIEPLKEKEKSFSTLMEVEAMQVDGVWEKAAGKILLYVKKDSLLHAGSIKYGDRILINMRAQLIKGPMNPNAFDYRKFLRYQNIHFNAFASFNEVHILENDGNDLYGWALRAQQACAEIIRKNIRNKEATGIVLSLVLGFKDDLEQPVKTAYASAGVMHILAVSGLHVGIFYSILSFLLSWLNQGKSKWLFALICLTVLWSYAFITGLSPSVLRAVTMFSSIIIAKAFARQSNIYNAIAASAFFLLCYDPFLIMSVGFQLSYIAVLGIIFLFPKFYHILSIENKFLDAIWQTSCVSLAAQLAVLPLSIYYFHQFPVYFLLANLLVIPAAFAMLALSIGLLVFHFIPWAERLIGVVLEFLVIWVNKFVYFVNTLPHSNLSNLYINSWQVALLMGIIIGFLTFTKFRKFSILVGIAGFICCYQVVEILHQSKIQDRSLVYYSTNAASVIGLSDGNFVKLLIASGDSLSKDDYEYNIKPSLLGKVVDEEGLSVSLAGDTLTQKASFRYGFVMVWNGKRVVIIDKKVPENWQLQHEVRTDLLILENDALDDLAALPENLVYDKLVIGNSNSYRVTNRLKSGFLSEDAKIIFPKEEGAFSLSW